MLSISRRDHRASPLFTACLGDFSFKPMPLSASNYGPFLPGPQLGISIRQGDRYMFLQLENRDTDHGTLRGLDRALSVRAV